MATSRPEDRSQLFLYQTTLDAEIPLDAPVRLFEEFLDLFDWSIFPAHVEGEQGRPPLPPRILASVILYGLQTRIRSSRQLELALEYRLDFRWLAHNYRIDHSTLCKFRVTHKRQLKDLNRQINLLAHRYSGMSFRELAIDGTKLRANNGRHVSVSPEKLGSLFDQEFDELNSRMDEQDELTRQEMPHQLDSGEARQEKLKQAYEELCRARQAGEPIPKRIPLTDPQSRITPNKEGGFAPNYTPMIVTDMATGMIVGCTVIPHGNEEDFLVPLVDEVEANYGVKPETVTADGKYAVVPNIEQMEERGIAFYSPIPEQKQNPAMREDLTQPVPESEWEKLPTSQKKGKKAKLDKTAFIYEEGADCYWCPMGKKLEFQRSTTQTTKKCTKQVKRYQAKKEECAACPLLQLCLPNHETSKKPTGRVIVRLEDEPTRERHKQAMRTQKAQQAYAKRAQTVERSFAEIKGPMDVRKFSLRGLDRVQTEWSWITLGYNIKRMMSFFSLKGLFKRSKIKPEDAVT